jgi:hypothetical protein
MSGETDPVAQSAQWAAKADNDFRNARRGQNELHLFEKVRAAITFIGKLKYSFQLPNRTA